MLKEDTLRRGLKTRTLGGKIYTFEVIDSTNNCARALASCWAPEGTVVIAEQQTAGKGRLGRTWQANPNENLTLSVILRPGNAPGSVNLLPLLVSVAVSEAVQSLTGITPECKWPNDLLIGGKKVAGILLEGSLKKEELEFVVVGIGINVNQTAFSPEIQNLATSLKLATGTDVNREELFKLILERLEAHYVSLKPGGFEPVLSLWQSRSTMAGKRVSVKSNGSVLTGTVKGLSPEGGLVLRSNGTEHTLLAGDVTVLGIDPDSPSHAPRH